MTQLFFQNDNRWKNEKFANTHRLFGDIGCLVTASANVKNLHTGVPVMTPCMLHDELKKNDGFTKDGLVIWSVLEKILGCKIDIDYKGHIDYDVNSLYVVHCYLTDKMGKKYGHFTNLIEMKDFKYYCYDVWDGKNKIKTCNDIDRIVKYIF